jgi:hypothetical protein
LYAQRRDVRFYASSKNAASAFISDADMIWHQRRRAGDYRISVEENLTVEKIKSSGPLVMAFYSEKSQGVTY